jgi:hypothetical protein
LDTSNPVVALCVEGRPSACSCRRGKSARTTTTRASPPTTWPVTNPARDSLRWNQEALTRADAVADDSVQGFYPSLCLNLG